MLGCKLDQERLAVVGAFTKFDGGGVGCRLLLPVTDFNGAAGTRQRRDFRATSFCGGASTVCVRCIHHHATAPTISIATTMGMIGLRLRREANGVPRSAPHHESTNFASISSMLQELTT